MRLKRKTLMSSFLLFAGVSLFPIWCLVGSGKKNSSGTIRGSDNGNESKFNIMQCMVRIATPGFLVQRRE